jgi:hypothetical protein
LPADPDYFRRRAEEEWEAAAKARSVEVRRSHEKVALCYAEVAQALASYASIGRPVGGEIPAR